MEPSPTSGGLHPPSAPHNLPQRPPAQPTARTPARRRRNGDRSRPPGISPDQASSQNGDRQDDGDGDGEEDPQPVVRLRESAAGEGAAQAVTPAAGRAQRRRDAKVSAKTPAAGAAAGVKPRTPATAGGSVSVLPPPPPSGAPAHVWDRYMQALPPTHRNRQAARAQVSQTASELGREGRIAALMDFAHSDKERKFLAFTSHLPSLDEERDAAIYEREEQRRSAISAAGVADRTRAMARRHYEIDFEKYTGQKPTFDPVQDTATLQAEATRREGVVDAPETSTPMSSSVEQETVTQETAAPVEVPISAGVVSAPTLSQVEASRTVAETEMQEATTAADKLQAANDQLMLTFVPAYARDDHDIHEDLTPVQGQEARITFDFSPEQGTGPPATFETDGSRAEFYRQLFEGEVSNVNEKAEKINDFVEDNGTSLDPQKYAEYLTLRAEYDAAIDRATRRLGAPPQSGQTREEAYNQQVDAVIEASQAAGIEADSAYKTWQIEHGEADVALIDHNNLVVAYNLSESERVAGVEASNTAAREEFLAQMPETDAAPLRAILESQGGVAFDTAAGEYVDRQRDTWLAGLADRDAAQRLRTILDTQGADAFHLAADTYVAEANANSSTVSADSLYDTTPPASFETYTAQVQRLVSGQDTLNEIPSADRSFYEQAVAFHTLTGELPTFDAATDQAIWDEASKSRTLEANAAFLSDVERYDPRTAERLRNTLDTQGVEAFHREAQNLIDAFSEDDGTGQDDAPRLITRPAVSYAGLGDEGARFRQATVTQEQFDRYTRTDPTLDSAYGPRASVEALSDLPTDALTEPRGDVALDAAAPARAPIVAGPDVPTPTPSPTGPLFGVTATPMPVGQAIPLPADIDGWKSHGTVFINNESVEVQDLINDVRGQIAHKVPGNDPVGAEGRAEELVKQYLEQGYLTGQVRMERFQPQERTLTREDLRGGFNIGGVQYSYADYFGTDEVQPGPRQGQRQRSRDAHLVTQLERLQGEYDAGRLQLDSETTVPHYALPDEAYTASELAGDIFAPVGTVQEIRGSLSPHSVGGRMPTGEERQRIGFEASMIAVDLVPLPLGEVAGGLYRTATRTGPDVTQRAFRRQTAELISQGVDPNTARSIAAQNTNVRLDLFDQPVRVDPITQLPAVASAAPESTTYRTFPKQRNLFGEQQTPVIEGPGDFSPILEDRVAGAVNEARLRQRFGPEYTPGGAYGHLKNDPDYLANLQAQYDYLGTQPINRNMPGTPAGSPEGTPAGVGNTRAAVSPDLYVAQQTELSLPQLTTSTPQPTYLNQFQVQPVSGTRPVLSTAQLRGTIPEAAGADTTYVRTQSGLLVPASAVALPHVSPDLFVAQQTAVQPVSGPQVVSAPETVHPFTGPQVVTAPLTGPQVVTAPLTGPQVVSAPLTGPQVVSAPLTGPQVVSAPLTGPQVVSAPLTGPQVVSAPLTGPQVVSAPLTGPQVVSAPLTGPQVVSAPLTGPQVVTVQQTTVQPLTGLQVVSAPETGNTPAIKSFTAPELRAAPQLASLPQIGTAPELRTDAPQLPTEPVPPRLPPARQDADGRRRRRPRLRPRLQGPEDGGDRASVTTPAGQGHPQEVQFTSLDHNVVNLRTGEHVETPLDQRNLKTLRVTRRDSTPTSGNTVEAGAVTVRSANGQVHASSSRAVQPRFTVPSTYQTPKPNNRRRRRGGGRRRGDYERPQSGPPQITIELG